MEKPSCLTVLTVVLVLITSCTDSPTVPNELPTDTTQPLLHTPNSSCAAIAASYDKRVKLLVKQLNEQGGTRTVLLPCAPVPQPYRFDGGLFRGKSYQRLVNENGDVGRGQLFIRFHRARYVLCADGRAQVEITDLKPVRVNELCNTL